MNKRVNKRISWYGFWVAVLVLGHAGFAYAEKIAFVNVGKVFDEYEKTKEKDKELTGEGEKKQSERESQVQEIRRLRDELALLSDKSKDEKQLMIDEKLKQLQDFDTGARRELQTKRDQHLREILKDIDDVIREIGKKGGYDYVFNERALLYHNDKFDITADVLKEMNSRYRSGAKTRQ